MELDHTINVSFVISMSYYYIAFITSSLSESLTDKDIQQASSVVIVYVFYQIRSIYIKIVIAPCLTGKPIRTIALQNEFQAILLRYG